MNLPNWLDLTTISTIGVLTIFIVQYLKSSIPEKAIPYFTIVIGICVSIFSQFYANALPVALNWYRIIFNGIIGAILADGGYKFFSGGGGSMPFTFPSKTNGTKKGDSK